MKHIGFCSMATLLVILVVAAGPAAAGEIYLLVAADTSKEGGIALSTGPDTGFIYDAFVANVPSDQLVLYGMERHRTWNADEDAASESTRKPWKGREIINDLADMGQKLLTAIDNCPAGPDDTILFFYSGHGAHDEDGHYLLMPDQKTTLSRQTVVQRIQHKNPRLAVVITDTCSNQLDRGLLPGPRMAIRPPEKISPLFAELFLNAEGLADFNSCKEGQIAAGPIGGGLMVVAMAYMGNKPEFHTAKNLGASVEPDKSSRSDSVSIPPVNYFRTIVEMHGGFEHGMMPNFDPEEPQYGVLWRYRDQRLSWSDFRKLVIKRTAELYESLPKSYKTHKGEYQATQTPQFYSLPNSTSYANGEVTGQATESDIQNDERGACGPGRSCCRRGMLFPLTLAKWFRMRTGCHCRTRVDGRRRCVVSVIQWRAMRRRRCRELRILNRSSIRASFRRHR